jgi:hypothetical protein
MPASPTLPSATTMRESTYYNKVEISIALSPIHGLKIPQSTIQNLFVRVAILKF